jgi:hypothetical protein
VFVARLASRLAEVKPFVVLRLLVEYTGELMNQTDGTRSVWRSAFVAEAALKTAFGRIHGAQELKMLGLASEIGVRKP